MDILVLQGLVVIYNTYELMKVSPFWGQYSKGISFPLICKEEKKGS